MDQFGKTIVEIETDGGELLWVTPPSVMLITALRRAIEARYPPIDEAAYHVPMEDAMVEGDTFMPPENAAALQAARADRARKIDDDLRRSAVAAAVDHPDGREAVLKRYRSGVEQTRRMLKLDAEFYDDWLVAANFHLIATQQDLVAVMKVVNFNLPLEEPEVAEGLRVFRHPVRRDAMVPSDAASGTAEPEGASAPRGTE